MKKIIKTSLCATLILLNHSIEPTTAPSKTSPELTEWIGISAMIIPCLLIAYCIGKEIVYPSPNLQQPYNSSSCDWNDDDNWLKEKQSSEKKEKEQADCDQPKPEPNNSPNESDEQLNDNEQANEFASTYHQAAYEAFDQFS